MKATTRLVLAVLIFSVTTTGAFAQAGTLDPDFATAGIGTYLPESQYDEGYDIIALADNSMLVCGNAVQNNTTVAFVTHILEDGTIDTSFGESNGYTFFEGTAHVIALAPDQTIYLAGTSFPNVSLAHVSALGIPDVNFGSGGVVLTSVAPEYTELHDMVIQPDGKIVLVGSGDVIGTGSSFDPFFLRYLPDGSLDTSFNGTGIATMESSATSEYMQAVALMADGSIIGSGYSDNGSNEQVILIKLNPDGTPDPSFGTAGVLSTSLGSSDAGAFGLMVKDGSIYVVGYLWQSAANVDTYLAKFNTDGTLDTSFGTNGTTMINIGSYDYLIDLDAQADGKIVAVGGTAASGFNQFAALTVRFDATGLLDPTFGVGGKSITNVGIISDELYGIAVQPDGKIIVTGLKYDVQYVSSMIVMRYLGDGTIGIADNETSAGQITIYPNPVSGTSTTLHLRDVNDAEVWISDLQGRTIGSHINVPKGMTSAVLSTSSLATGIYLVNVQSQGITKTLKMQVAK